MKLINFGRMIFGFWMGVAVTLKAMSKLLNKLISTDKDGIWMHAFKDNLADTFEIMLFGAPRSRYDKQAYYQRHKPDFNKYKCRYNPNINGYYGTTYRTYQQEEREKDDKIIEYLDMRGWDMPDVDAASDLGVTRYDIARCKMRHNRQKQNSPEKHTS